MEDVFEIFFDIVKGIVDHGHAVKACGKGRHRALIIFNVAADKKLTLRFRSWPVCVRRKRPELL
jgi:hypothetical protein